MSFLAAVIVMACDGPHTEGELRALLWSTTNYDKYTRPAVAALPSGRSAHTALPEEVRVQVRVLELADVDMKQRTIDVVFFLRAAWIDWRLRFNSTAFGGCWNDSFSAQGAASFPGTVKHELWHPDLFIRNMEGEDRDVLQESIWLRTDGRVHLGQRRKVRLSCLMNAEWMPWDAHVCPLEIGTFREGAPEVILGDLDDAGLVVLRNVDRSLSTWKLTDVPSHLVPPHTTNSADAESSLQMRVLLTRISQPSLLHGLVPAIICVFLAWISFFIERTAAPARVMMTVVALLAILQTLRATVAQMPEEMKLSRLEVILWISAVFVCAALVECGLPDPLPR